MTNEEPVRRFAAVVTWGTVYGPYNNGPNRKQAWMWIAEGEDAMNVAELLRPRLSTARRKQLEQVFRAVV